MEYHQNRAQVAPDAPVLLDFRCDEPVYVATAAVPNLWVVHGGGVHAGMRVNVATLGSTVRAPLSLAAACSSQTEFARRALEVFRGFTIRVVGFCVCVCRPEPTNYILRAE